MSSLSISQTPFPASKILNMVSQKDLEEFLERLQPLALENGAFEPLVDLLVHKKVSKIPAGQLQARSFFTHLMAQRILLGAKEECTTLPFVLSLYASNRTLFENPDLKEMGFNPLSSFSIQDLDYIFYLDDPCLHRFFDIPAKLCAIMAPLLQLLNDPDPIPLDDRDIMESFSYILRFCNQYTSRFLEAFMIEDSFINFFMRQPHFLAHLIRQNSLIREGLQQKLQDHPPLALQPLKSGRISLYYHLTKDPSLMILDAFEEIEGFSFSQFNLRALAIIFQDSSINSIIRLLLSEDIHQKKGFELLGTDIRLMGPMHKLFVDLIEAVFDHDSSAIQNTLASSLRLQEPEKFLYELSMSKKLSALLETHSIWDMFTFTHRIFKRDNLYETAPFFLSSFSFLSPDNKYLLIQLCGGNLDPLEKGPFDQRVLFLLKNLFNQASSIAESTPFQDHLESVEKKKIGASMSDFSDLEITTDRGVIRNPKSGKPLKISKSTAFYLFDVREAVGCLTDEREEYKLALYYYWNTPQMKNALLGLYPFFQPLQKAALLPFLEIKDLESIEIGDTCQQWIHFLTHLRSDAKRELIEGKNRLFFAKIAPKERALLQRYDLANPKNDYFENIPSLERKKLLERMEKFLHEIQQFNQCLLVKEWDALYQGIFAVFMENIDRELNLVVAILEKRYPQLV